jgi:hypothetical protein
MMIIALMSYSGWSNHVIQRKSAVLQTTLLHLFQYARQEAIYQNKIMIVSYSENDHCITVYSEKPFDVKRIFRLSQHNILHSNQPLGFRFHPEGRCLTPGTITLISKSDPRYQRNIIINDSGRPRLANVLNVSYTNG